MPDDPTEQPTAPSYPSNAMPAMPPTSAMPTAGQQADPWPHTGQTELAASVPGSGWRRRFWPLVIAVTAVLAVTMFLVVFLWPGGSAAPLDFHPLEEAGTIAVGDDDATPQLVSVDGDRVFIGADHSTEGVVVYGATLDSSEPSWSQAIPGMSEVRSLTVYPDEVVLLGSNADSGVDIGSRLMVALDVADGRPLWERHYDNATWLLSGEHITLDDDDTDALRGLGLRTGNEVWQVPFPEGSATVHPVVTSADLAGPSRLGSAHALPRSGDRVVMVAGDRSAQVINVRDGQPVGQGGNVADPDDVMYAYEDWLYVADQGEGRVYRYELANLAGQPQHLYTVADSGVEVTDIVACGDDLVCLREDGPEEVTVTAVDSGGGGVQWSHSLGEAEPELLLPVGDRLVVGIDEPGAVAYDQNGNQLLARPGAPVRIDEANLLLAVADSFGFGPLSLAGVAFGSDDADRTELGQVDDVDSEGCVWDDQYLLCPTSEGAGLWRFA